MEKQQKKYLYADKAEQIKRTNKFLTMGVIVYYIWILGLVWIAALRGVRTTGYAGMITALILICSIGADRKSTRLNSSH